MAISLSFSKWSMWNKCPAKFKFAHIDKLSKGVAGPAASRGSEIHQTVDDYLSGKSEQLHPDIHSYYGQFMFNLRNAGAIPEKQIAVDPLWKVVPWDGDTYCRSVLDAHIPPNEAGVVKVFEWKTGKMYPDHYDQREIYAIKAKVLYPEATDVEVTGVYFDLKKNSPTYSHPHYYQEMKIELWDNNFRRILRDETFIPNPNYGCRFCEFSRSVGGPCEF